MQQEGNGLAPGGVSPFDFAWGNAVQLRGNRLSLKIDNGFEKMIILSCIRIRYNRGGRKGEGEGREKAPIGCKHLQNKEKGGLQ